jgi:hypothetical protein
MRSHGSLLRVSSKAGGSGDNAQKEQAPKPIALRIARGILIPALVVASLGATAAAAPGHDHIRTAAGQTASSILLRPASHSKACRTTFVPWMYAPARSLTSRTSAASRAPKLGVPWMYTTSGVALMSPGSRVPWMYGPDSRVPWMYGPCRSAAISPARRAAAGTPQ